MQKSIQELAGRLAQLLTARGERVAAAESCTGGWVAKALTDRAGSSDWFECGWVTYSNAAKQRLLGVPASLLLEQGAVSAPVVEAMVGGALAQSDADLAVAVSGIAGPGGGSPEKPVGTVWLAWQRRGEPACSHCYQFSGDREAVRRQSVETALTGLIERLSGQSD